MCIRDRLDRLTAIVETSAGVHAFLPRAVVRRHLVSSLRRALHHRVRAETADVQLGEVPDEVRVRHPATDRARIPLQQVGAAWRSGSVVRRTNDVTLR